MSHNTDEMRLADVGSKGLWFPAQEFLLEKPIMDLIKSNFNLTLDFFARFKNKVTERYFSAAWEIESEGQNFFMQVIKRSEMGCFFPPPRIFWPAFLHLKNKQARGVGVFVFWFLLPTSVKFVFKITFQNV